MPQVINDSVQQLINDLKVNGIWAVIAQDFYEAAAYTPTYLGGTTPGTTTYTTQEGIYVRVGAIVHAWAVVGWSNATGTGDAQISLPFAAASFVSLYPGAIRYSGVTWTGTDPQIVINAGNSYLRMQGVSSNAAPTITAIETAGSATIYAAYLTS